MIDAANHKNKFLVFMIGFFYLLALPMILSGYNSGRAFFDQQHFHLPSVLLFIEQFDFSTYRSATTPGYHALLALFGRFFSADEIFLKLAGSLFSAFFIAVLASQLYPRFYSVKTLFLLLPLIFSLYFFPAAVWLIPDNLAWLSVALIFTLTSKIPLTHLTSPIKIQYAYVGFILVGAMLVRQSNLWLASVVWATALASLLWVKQSNGQKVSTGSWAFLVTLPAFIGFYLFYLLWGGLVPPEFQKAHQHFSFSVPAFFFSVFFVYALFYLPVCFSAIRSLAVKRKYYWIGAGLTLGFILAIFPDTNYDRSMGRFSGLWNFVKIAPSVANKSLLILACSTLGGGLFFVMLLLLNKALRLVVSLATLVFIFSQMANLFVYERYFSGYVFILIFIMLAQADNIKADRLSKWVWLGPVVFTLLNGAILMRGLFWQA